jgi:hypothetical protein
VGAVRPGVERDNYQKCRIYAGFTQKYAFASAAARVRRWREKGLN